MFLDPPEVRKPQRLVHLVNISESITIECLADASPGAQYVWKKAGSGFVVNNRNLQLNNVNDSDGGYYTCTAENSLGSDNFTILVKVTSKSHFSFLAIVSSIVCASRCLENKIRNKGLQNLQKQVLNPLSCYMWVLTLFLVHPVMVLMVCTFI